MLILIYIRNPFTLFLFLLNLLINGILISLYPTLKILVFITT